MKLYMHPVSTTSRPVLLFIADNEIEVETAVIDLMTGEHHQEPFASLNPNRMVPVLEDDGFLLTESIAILQYLADKHDLPSYPKDAKKRAKVHEMLAWFASNFIKDYDYGIIYPQIFPHQKRPSDDVQAGTIAWSKEKANGWLAVLDGHVLGDGRKYLCGDEITIADYYASGHVSLGDVIRCDLSKYPNVAGWLDRMKGRANWGAVHEVFDGFTASVAEQPFDAI
jgi:glutathione S-transferase